MSLSSNILLGRRMYFSPASAPDTSVPARSAESLALRKKYDDALFKNKEEHRKRIHDLERAHEESLDEKDHTIRSLKLLVLDLERKLVDSQNDFNENGRRSGINPVFSANSPVQKLLEQLQRLQEDKERTLVRLTELELQSGSVLDASFDSVDSLVGKTERGETPDQMGQCTTDTEKELEQTKRHKHSLEGEILRLKDENYRLRQFVSKLQDRSPHSTPESNPGLVQKHLGTPNRNDSHDVVTGSDVIDVHSLDRQSPGRGSLMVKNGQIATLENQIQFLKKQLTLKTEQLIKSELQLRERSRSSSVAEEKVEEQKREREEREEREEEERQLLASVRLEHEEEVNRLTTALTTVSQMALRVHREFLEVKAAHEALRSQVGEVPGVIGEVVMQTQDQIQRSLSSLGEENRTIVQKYLREMKLRKKYHNELVQLRGNIRVFCRVRPRIREDGDEEGDLVVTPDIDDDSLLKVNNTKGRDQQYDLDKVFGLSSTQAQIFEEVSSLVRSAIDGYNVCIFAYGQTGSGKTYTMEGVSDDPGINQRALQLLFEETSDASWTYDISAGVMEIYNESIRDLLNPDPANKLEVKMKSEGGFHVPGLMTLSVSSLHEVNQVFETGRRNRATASTNMNEHSSRSHCLLCVTVRGTNPTTGSTSVGRLNLVDLAGSERLSKSQAGGARLKEAQNINRSLACLGDVIHALRNKNSHVPYRNSKLTYLLQDSLGGDSKTLMIVQVSPVEKNVCETLCSLAFAQRVRGVELGPATRTSDSGSRGQSNGQTPTGRPSNLQIPHTPLSRSSSISSSASISPRQSPVPPSASSPSSSSHHSRTFSTSSSQSSSPSTSPVSTPTPTRKVTSSSTKSGNAGSPCSSPKPGFKKSAQSTPEKSRGLHRSATFSVRRATPTK